MSGRLFISYRRDDEPAEARSLRDRLALAFGDDAIFMDVDSLSVGADFRQSLDSALNSCAAFIAVIGPRWLPILQARIAAGDVDYVMAEVASALRRDILVIPALVQGAKMPAPEELPTAISQLAFRQACSFTHETFGASVAALVETLREKAGIAGRTPTAALSTATGLKVLIFTHDEGITPEVAEKLRSGLAADGMQIETIEHRDRRCPDAIYISERMPAALVRTIVRHIKTDVKYIFPIDYATKSHSEMKSVAMAVGLMADFKYYATNSAEKPYAITQPELSWLIEPGLDQAVFVERLLYIAAPRKRPE